MVYEDVETGTQIAPLVKHPTTSQLVRYAGASDDYYELHYDKDYALSGNFPAVVVHGALKNAFLGQLVTDWIGTEGTLRKLTCRYRAVDHPNDTLTCKAKVTAKYVKNGENVVECELWLENGRGEVTTTGSAMVHLPSRSG